MANAVTRKVKIVFESDLDKFQEGQRRVETSLRDLGTITKDFRSELVRVGNTNSFKIVQTAVLETAKDLGEVSKALKVLNENTAASEVGFAREFKAVSETAKSTAKTINEEEVKKTATFKKEIKERLQEHRQHMAMQKLISDETTKAEIENEKIASKQMQNILASLQNRVAGVANARVESQRTYANTALGIEKKLADDIAAVQLALTEKLRNYQNQANTTRTSAGFLLGQASASTSKATLDINRLITAADAAKAALEAKQAQERVWRQEAASYRQHQQQMQQSLEQRLELERLAIARNGGRKAVLLQQQANREATIRSSYAAQIRVYETALQHGFITTAQANQYATAALNNMQSQLQSTRTALEQQIGALGEADTRTRSFAIRVFEMIGLYRLWSFAINTVISGLKSVPSSGIEMQATHAALLASLSTNAAGVTNPTLGEERSIKTMQILQDEAKRAGINILTVEKNYRTFLASASIAGESVNTVNKMFRDLNTTIAALHMSADRAELTFLAMAQMFNKGKVQSEELVKQLGNLLPGAFAAFAKANHISTQQLVADMKAGAVSAHETMKNFLEFYAKRYADSFTFASQGFNANMERMKTAWTNFSRALFIGSQNDLIAIIKFATSVLEALTPVEYKLQRLANYWELYKQTFASVFQLSAIDALINRMEKLDTLNAALATKPLQGIKLSELTLPGQAKALADEIETQALRIANTQRQISTITNTRAGAVTTENPARKAQLESELKDMDMLIAKSIDVSKKLEEIDKENAIEAENVGELLNKADKAREKQMRDSSATRKEILDNRLNDLRQATSLEEQIYSDNNRALEKQYKAGLISLQEYSEQAHKLDAEITAKKVTAIKEQMSLVQAEIDKQRENISIVQSEGKEGQVLPKDYKETISKELSQYAKYITQASKTAGVSEAILYGMMGVESGGNLKAISTAGAKGLGQLMKDAWSEVMPGLDYSKNVFNPELNIKAMALYFAKIWEHYKGQSDQLRKSIAAYNAGPGRIDKAIVKSEATGKDFLSFAPEETQGHVKKVMKAMEKAGVTPEVTASWEKYSESIDTSSKSIEQLKGKLSTLTGELKKVQNDANDAANKVKEIALAEAARIQAKYATPDETYTKELALLDQLRIGIDGVRISELQYIEEVTAAKAKRDSGNQQIFEKATAPTDSLKEYNSALKQIESSYNSLALTSQDFFSGSDNWVDKFINSLLAMNKALEKNTREQEKEAKLYKTALAAESKRTAPALDPKVYEKQLNTIQDLEDRHNKALQQSDAERTTAQIQGITSITGALINGFRSRSESEAEAAQHAKQMQMIMLGEAVALAVANQAASGDPYTVWARIAAVVATLASYGITGKSAGGGTPKIDTKTQGTVLGDATASSKTTENISTLMKDIHAKEYSALLNINDSIKELSDSILAAVTGVFQRGDLATPTLPPDTTSMFVNSSTKVSQNILQGTGATIGEIIDGLKLQLSQFLEIKKTTDLLFGHLVDKYVTITPATDRTNRDVTAIFESVGKVLIESGKILGMQVETAVRQFRIPDIALDIKDMTGEEAVKYFNSYISTLVDNIAAEIYPTLTKYQQLGEGMGQTVVRVAADVGIITSTFEQLGAILPDSANGIIAFSEALVKAAGDTDALRQNIKNFYENFYDENTRLVDTLKFMETNLGRYDVNVPVSRQGYKDTTVNALNTAGSANAAYENALAVLETKTKEAFAPFTAELDFLKENADKYGQIEKDLYKVVLEQRTATVAAEVKGYQDIADAAEKEATSATKVANLLLEQTDNADALYTALEKGQEVLDSFGVTVSDSFNTKFKTFATHVQQLGLSVPYSVQAFKDLIASQDITTNAGKVTATTLLLMSEEVLNLNSLFEQTQEEFKSVAELGFNANQTDTVVKNLTTSFGDLGSGLTVVKNIITGFLTDIQNKDLNSSYYTTKQQQLIDSNPGWKDAGISASMTPAQILSALGVTYKDVGAYLARPGLDAKNDPAVQFFNNASSLAQLNNTTVQDNYANANKDLQDGADKLIENAKKFAEIQQKVWDSIAGFAGNEYDKKILAINAEMQSLVDSVKELGQGELKGIEELRSLKIGEVNHDAFLAMKPLLEITNSLGITSLNLSDAMTKNSAGLWEFSSAATALIPSLTTVVNNIDLFKTALTSLGNAATIVEQANFSDTEKQIATLVGSFKKDMETLQEALDIQFGTGSTPEKVNASATLASALGIQIGALFKPLTEEFSNLKLPQYAQDLNSLNKEMQAWSQSLEAAKEYIAPEEYLAYASALRAVSEARVEALRKEAKAIVDTNTTNFSRIKDSDFESTLHGILDTSLNTIASLVQAGGTFSDVMTIYQQTLAEGSEALTKATKEIKDNFKEIYKAIASTRAGIEDEITRLVSPETLGSQQKTRAEGLYATAVQDKNYQDQLTAIGLIQSAIMESYSYQIDALQTMSDYSKTIRDYLKDLKLDTGLTTLSPEAQLGEARTQFTDLLAKAKGGDKDALQKITDTASKYLESAKTYYASTPEYASIFDFIQTSLGGLAAPVDYQQQIAEATSQTKIQLEKLYTLLDATKVQQKSEETKQLVEIQNSANRITSELATAIVSIEGIGQVLGKELANFLKEAIKKFNDMVLSIQVLPNMPQNIIDLANEVSHTMELEVIAIAGADLPDDIKLLAINGISSISKDINLLAQTSLDSNAIQLALDTGLDLSKTVEFFATVSGISNDAKILGLNATQVLWRYATYVITSSLDDTGKNMGLHVLGVAKKYMQAIITSDLDTTAKGLKLAEADAYLKQIWLTLTTTGTLTKEQQDVVNQIDSQTKDLTLDVNVSSQLTNLDTQIIELPSVTNKGINVAVDLNNGKINATALMLSTLQTNTINTVVNAIKSADSATVTLATKTSNAIGVIVSAINSADNTTKELAFKSGNVINTLVTALTTVDPNSAAYRFAFNKLNSLTTEINAVSKVPTNSAAYKFGLGTINTIITTVYADSLVDKTSEAYKLVFGSDNYILTKIGLMSTVDPNSDEYKLALGTANAINTIVNAVSKLSPTSDAYKLAFNTGNTISTVVKAISSTDTTTRDLALKTANTIATVVNATNHSDIATRALALNTANAINTTVTALTTNSPSSDAYKLALNNLNTINTSVTALTTNSSSSDAYQLAFKNLNTIVSTVNVKAGTLDTTAVGFAKKLYVPTPVTASVNITKGSQWDTIALTLAQHGYNPKAVNAIVNATQGASWDTIAVTLARGGYNPSTVTAIINAAKASNWNSVAENLAKGAYSPSAINAFVNAKQGINWDSIAVTLAQNGYHPSIVSALVNAGKASNWDGVAENLARGVYSPAIVNAKVSAVQGNSDSVALNLFRRAYNPSTVLASVQAILSSASDGNAVRLATSTSNTLNTLVKASTDSTLTQTIRDLALDTTNTLTTTVRAATDATLTSTIRDLALDTTNTVNVLVKAHTDSTLTQTIRDLAIDTTNTVNTVVRAATDSSLTNDIRKLAINTQNNINSYVKVLTDSSSSPDAITAATRSLNNINTNVKTALASGYNGSALAVALMTSNSINKTINTLRGSSWNDTAATIASTVNGGNATVTATATLTLDSVLNNSILSYNKADVAAIYLAISEGTWSTHGAVEALRNQIGISQNWIGNSISVGTNGYLASILNSLNNIYNNLQFTAYSRLWSLEVYLSDIKWAVEHPLTVRSDYRSANSSVSSWATFADGGITNTPAIFGEAGPEAAVPLPDGRTIPVSFTNSQGANFVQTEAMLSEMKMQTEEIKRSRQETTVRQDAMIQKLSQVERRISQLEAVTSLGVVR